MQVMDMRDVGNYYNIRHSDIGEYTPDEFYTILVNGMYQSLPTEVSLAIFKCLQTYKGRIHLYDKSGYLSRGTWTYEAKDYVTGKINFNTYKFELGLPFNRLDRQVYIDFINHYIDVQIEYTMSTVLKTKLEVWTSKGKKPYTTPEFRFRYLLSEITTLGFWLLGKKEADKLFDKIGTMYLQRIKRDYSEDVYIKCLQYRDLAIEEYRLIRGNTRLNKGTVLPVNP